LLTDVGTLTLLDSLYLAESKLSSEEQERVIALPTFYLAMSYTRGFEIEADRFALQRLKDRGLSVDNFISIMHKLEGYRTQARFNSEELDDLTSLQERQEEKLLRYFASHPLTADRIALAVEYAE